MRPSGAGRSSTLAALLCCALAACGGGERPAGPNVILISIDTLRADHLGCYGHSRNTSPQLDRLAAGATLYRRSFASSPWTIPSHASMFTGKLPFEHGAHSIDPPDPRGDVYPLGLDNLTLAEALADEGYDTGAFIANWAYLVPELQLNQGFQTYEVHNEHAGRLNQRIFRWLTQKAEAPFFLFINYIDTHRPYNVRPRPGLLDQPVVEDGGQLLDQLMEQVLPGRGPIPADLVKRVKDQYDTSIANLDEALGALLERLRRMELLDSTLIVITSDHGEYFGEHHLVEHSKDIYQEAVWVPLIVRAPGQTEGREVDEPVSSTDVPALIYAHFEGERAARFRKAFPDRPGEHPVVTQNYYTRPKDLYHKTWGQRFMRVRTAIYDWPLKLIRSSDGHHELYDLEADPREADNLYARRTELAARLFERLEQVEASRPRYQFTGSPEQRYSPEQLQRLREMGYIGK